jgi:hypothetical protein
VEAKASPERGSDVPEKKPSDTSGAAYQKEVEELFGHSSEEQEKKDNSQEELPQEESK